MLMLQLLVLGALLTAGAVCQVVCASPTKGCQICRNSYECEICLLGFYEAPASAPPLTYQACAADPRGCTDHTDAVCTTCDLGYVAVGADCLCRPGSGYSTAEQKCKFCAKPFCIWCAGDFNACGACDSLYGLDVNGNCVPCSTNCRTCSTNSSKCTECLTGYGLNVNFTCDACQVTNCKDCSSGMATCVECNLGFGPSGPTQCTACPSNCVDCSFDSGFCTQCGPNTGLVLKGPSKGTCASCAKTNCFQCFADKDTCEVCAAGFNLMADGSCGDSSCGKSNCIQCGGFMGGCKVGKCIAGFGEGFGDCLNCINGNCAVCDTAIGCMYCKPGKSNTGLGCIEACVDSSCLDCSAAKAVCLACATGRGVSATGTCIACAVPNCAQCNYDASRCTRCTSPFALNEARNCVNCKDTRCKTCSNVDYANCAQCLQGYAPSAGACTMCSDQNCYECSPNPSTCTSCINRWVAVSGACVPCTSNCFLCTSPTVCLECLDGFANLVSSCSPCTDPNCLLCGPSDPLACLRCTTGYLLIGSSCVLCQVPNCKVCKANSPVECSLCAIGYGIDPLNLQCSFCVAPFCIECPADIYACQRCQDPYALSGGACVVCDVTCLTCHEFSSVYCLSCYPAHALVGIQCIACPQFCHNCTSGTSCFVCWDGYFVNSVSLCDPCPVPCTLCQQIAPSLIECSQCEPYFEVVFNSTSGIDECHDICGDGFAITYPCDHALGVPLDGCTENCSVEANFVCRKDGNFSTCSYSLPVRLVVKEVKRLSAEDNSVIIVLTAEPLLQVMLSHQLYTGYFSFGSGSLSVTKSTFDAGSQEFSVTAEFLENFSSLSELRIFFTPLEQYDTRFYATPSSSVDWPLPANKHESLCFYSPFARTISSVWGSVALANVAAGWLALFLSICAHRLAGLELLVLVQFGYLAFLWFNAHYYTPFLGMKLLKYSTGYAHEFVVESEQAGRDSAPFTSVFEVRSLTFSNNLNLMLIPQVLSLAALLAVFAVNRAYVCYHSRRLPNKIYYVQSSEFIISREPAAKKLARGKEVLLQLLAYSTPINLMNCISTTVMEFRNDSGISTLDIALMSVYWVSLGFLVWRFWTDPDPFEQFRYSFRVSDNPKLLRLYSNQFLINIAFYISMPTLMIMCPQQPFLPLAPSAIMLVYVIAARPYDELSENIRCVLFVVTYSCIAGFRVYLHYGGTNLCNSALLYLIPLVIYCGLLPLAALFSLVSLVHHMIFMRQLMKKLEEAQLNDPDFVRKKTKMEILRMLVKIDPARRKQSKKLYVDGQSLETQTADLMNTNGPRFNIFKEILEPKGTLVDLSRELCQQTISLQRQALSMGTPLHINTSLNEFSQPGQIYSANKTRDQFTPRNSYTRVHKQQSDAHFFRNPSSIKAHKQGGDPVSQLKIRREAELRQILESPERIAPMARQIAVQESRQINLTCVNMGIEKQMTKEARNPTRYLYLEFYDHIDCSK